MKNIPSLLFPSHDPTLLVLLVHFAGKNPSKLDLKHQNHDQTSASQHHEPHFIALEEISGLHNE